jgi:hypothetical protein
VNTAPPKPSQFADGLRRVDKVMRRALAKKPEDRFNNCTAFVAALEEALFSKPVGVPMWAKVAAAGAVLAVGLGFGLSYLNKTDTGIVEHKKGIDGNRKSDKTETTLKDDGARIQSPESDDIVPPPPPPEPTFALALSANNKPLTAGFSFSKGDSTFGDLGKGDLVANISAIDGRVPTGATVTIEWEVNGKVYSRNEFTGRSLSGGKLEVPYNNMPTTGDYRVQLLLNGKEKRSFEFTIKPDS